jgi:ribosomal protein S18 acetylase RimI-like enzyme
MINEGRLRLALQGELEAIFDCDALAADQNGRRRVQIASAVDRGNCFVWDANGRILGFIVVLPEHFFGQDFVELLMVSALARRLGVGRTLLREVVGSSAAEVWISTNESNRAMRALLESEGWVFSGQLEGIAEGDPELFFYLSKSA